MSSLRQQIKKIESNIEQISVISRNPSQYKGKYDVEKAIKETNTLINYLEMDAHSVPSLEAQDALLKVQQFKTQMACLSILFKEPGSPFISSSASLMDTRNKALTATAQLNQSSERIRAAGKLLAETEELGMSALSQLQNQRSKIENAVKVLNSTQNDLNSGAKTISTMERRSRFPYM
mmetsp:Transcript_28929/g.53157  ORF Transcript_28929/g.53157 Transcript_28929/m.53157 type:complete len:178 (-) Transcript_28929:145-678(-)